MGPDSHLEPEEDTSELMTGLQFLSSLVSALAWPTTALLVVLLLRRPLGQLLSGPMSRLKAGPGGVEFEWDRKAEEVRREVAEATPDHSKKQTELSSEAETALAAELESLAKLSPPSAILESYSRVERQLHEMLSGAGVAVDRPAGAVTMARLAERHGLISRETREAIEGLSVLRNLAAHGQASVTVNRALEYAALADGVLYAMNRTPGGASFNDVPGQVGLLDADHKPLGERQDCRFAWGVGRGSWSVQLLTQHQFDFQTITGEPWYIAIYSGPEGAETMFTLPMIGRPVSGAVLQVG